MSKVLLVLVNGADRGWLFALDLSHLYHFKCNKSLIHKHCVFDVTWSVEQNRGTNILSVDTGAVFQELCIKLNAEHSWNVFRR